MSDSDKLESEYYKLIKLKKQYDGVLRTSRNPSQQQRVSKDLQSIENQIDHLKKQVSPEEFKSWTENNSGSSASSPKEKKKMALEEYQSLSKVPMVSLGPGADSKDVNLLYSVLVFFEEQFFPAISDKHIKLDFTLGQERDGFYNRLENCKRNLRNLQNTLEDMHLATREDQKSQLLEMKVRYSRYFMNESATFFKGVITFWEPILEDIKEGGHRCMNPEDYIEINRKLEQPSILDGVLVEKVIERLVILIRELIDYLRLPDFA
jgi:hypothetical protein